MELVAYPRFSPQPREDIVERPCRMTEEAFESVSREAGAHGPRCSLAKLRGGNRLDQALIQAEGSRERERELVACQPGAASDIDDSFHLGAHQLHARFNNRIDMS